jgi:gliding-associated putative ABC transporter substrate-binding component GldG
MAEKKKFSKGIFNWSFFAIITAAVILLNIISSFLYKRIDMTEDKRYSLSAGTISFLENPDNFQNRLSLKIYFDGKLPAELKHFRNSIEDKLKEFKQYAGDRIEYQFIDPNVGSENEQQALFESLYGKGKGILPMDIVYMKDGSQSQMLLWPGAVIDYGGSTVNTIQFLPGTSPGKPYDLNGITEMIENSINNMEYMLISSLRRATQKSKPRVGFLQGHGELTFAQTQRARSLIAPYYAIADVAINDSLAALENIDGLIIARPTQKFSDRELYIIDQFVMRGGRLMCFLDALNLDEDSLNKNGMTHTTRNETGLERMLFDYGLKLNDNYVVDARCAPKPVPFAKQSMIPWFFHVLASPTRHPISRNLEPVSLKYASEIQFVGNSKNTLTPILTSSTNSNATGLAPMVNLGMPLNYGKNPELIGNPTAEINKRCLAGLAEGKFESYFKNRIVEEFANNPLSKYKGQSTKEGKVLLIGNGRFIANSYDSMPAKNGVDFMYRPTEFNDLRMDSELAQVGVPLYFGNQEFFQNLADYMLGDHSVIDIRSRQIDIHAIDKEKIKSDATFYKIMNLLLPVVLVLLFALVMSYIRKRKYVQK